MAHDDTPEDSPAAPTPAPVERGPAPERAGWPLLAILALVGSLLVVVVVQVDIEAVADPGWRDNALWAAGAALILLGLGLAAVAWTVATEAAGSTLPRVAVLAAVIGAVGAVVVLGLAEEQGGEIATSSVAPQTAIATAEGLESEPEPPLGLNDALAIENLTSVALPVTERTLVTLDLTPPGNQFLAGAMGCRAQDLRDNEVLGTAVGGTWVQPLVVVGPPVREDGDLVTRCRRTTVRLPIGAGVALPRF